jgi:putative PIN family toxin of toxin-antitoxin system
MIRACLDTNVLISGLISSTGAPREILSALKRREFTLITSDDILAEIKKVLNYPKIKKNYNLTPEQIKRFVAVLSKYSHKTEGELDLKIVEDDPGDNKFLSCAIEGSADLIVSGDIHLKSLRSYQGIEIITPKDFELRLKRS